MDREEGSLVGDVYTGYSSLTEGITPLGDYSAMGRRSENQDGKVCQEVAAWCTLPDSSC